MKNIDDTDVIMTAMHLKQASSLLKNYEEEISLRLLELADFILGRYNVNNDDVVETESIISSYNDVDKIESIS